MTVVDSSPSTSPAAIDAVPLRHPWRWVAAVVIVVLVGLFLYGMATNPAYRWNIFAEYLFNDRILFGVWNTLQLTIYSMVLAIVLGDKAEEAFRQSLLASQGSLAVFWSNGLVGTIMALGLIALFWPLIQEGWSRLRDLTMPQRSL